MLNDWSDRSPKRKGLAGSAEFMLGALAMLVGLAILAGVVASLLG